MVFEVSSSLAVLSGETVEHVREWGLGRRGGGEDGCTRDGENVAAGSGGCLMRGSKCVLERERGDEVTCTCSYNT